jgi:hypothetical protein
VTTGYGRQPYEVWGLSAAQHRARCGDLLEQAEEAAPGSQFQAQTLAALAAAHAAAGVLSQITEAVTQALRGDPGRR